MEIGAAIFPAQLTNPVFTMKEDITKKGNSEGITAVSYTHLDVYKRQVLYK